MLHQAVIVTFAGLWAMGSAQVSLQCNDRVDASGGSFLVYSHPGFMSGSRYPNRYTCSYVIQPGACERLSVSCDVFDLSGRRSRRCRGDRMTFDNNDDIHRSYCGDLSNKLPSFETSSRNPLTITFRSNYWFNDRGARCSVECIGSEPPVEPPTDPGDPPPTPSDCRCGQKLTETRIVGGVETQVNEWPWQVGLVDTTGRAPYCGGSVLDSRWIITAAHCVGGGVSQVLLGEHDFNDFGESDEFRVNVRRVVRHPDYDSRTFDHDYALLELEEPIDFAANVHVRPVCLPETTPPDGSKVYVTGWGTLASGGSQSNTLQEVEVELINEDVCNQQNNNMITDTMICAGIPDVGGKDACQGDSGGPLVYDVTGTNTWELIGLTSWGYGCADPDFPGVYAEVAEVIPWIRSTLNLPSGDGCPRA